ncbi:hypothetical protein [Mucilaginibacter sp.]|uniref:phosphoribosyltransferase-like protein n=1 Tax=Mucilaginibacter sp. TaxID=1882438 RepID=UPI002845ECB6|nr:hypothetical protein [Mucilaginibacter sp.]MDR3693539.1 hypothetical protein [Mucilaginibacter sp.]
MSNFGVKNFIKLRALFKEKGWHNNVEDDYVFESFSHLLNNLTLTEQELILDLAERYLWIDNGKYIPLLKDLLSEKECVEDLASFEKVIFFPVIKPTDQNKTKSGNLLIYHVKTIKPLLPEPIKNRQFIVLENFDQISETKFKLGKKDVFVLIDDFLGTGKTIDATLKKVCENKYINIDQIRVVGFTALKPSLALLSNWGIKGYFKNILSKGISEYYTKDVEDKLLVMKKIEKMSMAPKEYKMGFGKSEALVTMARTPNNTFSIFWSSHIKDEIEYSAPFPRY